MKLQRISYEEMLHLIRNGILEIENRTKYKNENRNYFFLSLVIIVITLFPIWVLIIYFDLTSMIFLIFIGMLDTWIFLAGYGNWKIAKYPEQFFWRYFIEKKFELKFLGTIEEGGEEYAVHGFVNEACVLSTCAFMLLKIRKDIHEKAMKLMKGGNYEIAVDADGRKKVVINGGEVVDVDIDTLLVMKLILTIYDLYGEDINRMWYRRYGMKTPGD